MPKNGRALDQQLEEEDSQTAQARAGALAQDIPPASEPLEGPLLETLSKVVQQAVPILSGGQVPELELPPMPNGADAVPPELGIPLMTLGAFLSQAAGDFPGIDQYAFDPAEAMSSNQGLAEATHKIAGLMEDQKVLGALSGVAGARKPPSEDISAGEGSDQLEEV